MGHPVLKQPAQPIADPCSPEVRRLIADMIETMVDANGAGLAAPQVYEPVRLVVFHAPLDRSAFADDPVAEELEAPLTILINPEIEVLDATTEAGWEGCLSVPGLRGLVERPRHIRYRGVTPDGNMLEREARGFHARVVQHECDHLDGILYPQRMSDLGQLVFESEIHHLLQAQADRPSEEPETAA